MKNLTMHDDKYYYRIIRVLKGLTRPIVKLRVEGLENIPLTGGVVLAPNHVSNLDPVIAGVAISARRPARALAKASLFALPVVGKVLTKMGHVPVVRNSAHAADAYKVAVERVKNGDALALFPEGTIPPDITRLGPLKTGAARLALETGMPLIPVGQWGVQKTLPPRKNPIVPLIKALFRRPEHVIVVGKPITPVLIPGSSPSAQVNVKALTQQLAVEIEKLVSELR